LQQLQKQVDLISDYDGHDRGRPLEDIRILERGLKKVKELGPDHFLDKEWIRQWATPE
jgi:hypothetical protein